MAERLAKFMARSGVCSRRQAEEFIRQQRVTVNGEVVDTPAFNVSGNEKILLDGEKLPEKQENRLWLYHKPVGLVTTHKDEKGRPTVFDNLPVGLPRVISVGRLDLNSEGLCKGESKFHEPTFTYVTPGLGGPAASSAS